MGGVTFIVNGRRICVGPEVGMETSLNAYLRYHLNLRGTKAMCHEGGCGACIVSARVRHPVTGVLETIAVNSCLVLVISCDDWEITTVEGLGDRLKGYHPIQTRLKNFHGTQCGYCSPGWVMSMYSLLDKNLTMAELEKSFGSNTCRCTGYRPILDAMKSFASDASPDLYRRVQDIEELHRRPACSRTAQPCTGRAACPDQQEEHDWCVIDSHELPKLEAERICRIDFKDHTYFIANSVDDIFTILSEYRTDNYMLIAGNTAKGVLGYDIYGKILIYINNVAELKISKVDQNLVLGGGMSIENTKDLFKELSETQPDFAYLRGFEEHLGLVAHVPVRNLGTLAGNLMLKHRMPSFQSDIFLLFETVGAYLTIKEARKEYEISLPTFLETDMCGKIIYDIRLPPLNKSYRIKTYKIMPRSQNAHAIVNAGFMVKLDRRNSTVQKVTIVYGGISADFVHASKTEQYLKGKYLFSNQTLQGALSTLRRELHPEHNPPEPSPECRKKLALGLFYKFVLSICPASIVDARLRSGGTLIERPLSRGTQDFQTDSDKFPLNEPVPKLEGLIQCSGEAQYVNDMPSIPNQVFGAFVLASVHSGAVDTINSDAVLKIDGVLAVYTAKDIPGKNSFTCPNIIIESEEEDILAYDNIKFNGQPIAIVVAVTEALAAAAAKQVEVTYKNGSTKDPVLTISEAKKDPKRLSPGFTIEPKGRGTDVKKIVKGSYSIGSQYYYTMEPQTCLVVPVDKGLKVYSSTQWMDHTQIVISKSLKIPESRIEMKVRRVGGAFGSKISRSAQTATACALVAKLMNVPCRFILPMQTNMASLGGRLAVLAEYEVGVNNDGKIQYLELNCHEDKGSSLNEKLLLSLTISGIKNCYNFDNWHVQVNSALTDLPTNSACRAPGNCEGMAMVEEMMDHIASEVQRDPIAVREANMRTDDNPLPQIVADFKKEADYDNRFRAIQEYNQLNKWRKKFISIVPMSYPAAYLGNYSAMVSIYQGDGTVSISGGGIEMGQGLNTKVAQVCAYTLGIPLKHVSIVPSYSFVSSNNAFSASSIATECVCYSVTKACEILQSRLKPIKDSLTNPTWKEVVAKAGAAQIDMVASYMVNDKEIKPYNVFGVAILEVELDCLTGEHVIQRVDLLQDTGISLNPALDFGQIEGAFTQGLGYWTSEKLIYDMSTGRKLTNRSWNYKVPLALDIPADFRVKLRYNSRNSTGVLGSKAVAECPLCMSVVITHALRGCILAFINDRSDDVFQKSPGKSQEKIKWLDISAPYDVESMLSALNANVADFVLSNA